MLSASRYAVQTAPGSLIAGLFGWSTAGNIRIEDHGQGPVQGLVQG